jgi:hypothetical protein
MATTCPNRISPARGRVFSSSAVNEEDPKFEAASEKCEGKLKSGG